MPHCRRANSLQVFGMYSKRAVRLVSYLTARGVHFYTDGDQLRFEAPDTPAFRDLQQTTLWAETIQRTAEVRAIVELFEAYAVPRDAYLDA